MRQTIYRSFFALLVLLPSSTSAGQQPAANAPRKQARAVRVQAGAIRLDGHLDDAAWQQATPITDFLQAEPTENAPPADRMEVRFVYDEDALWIGARMESASGQVPAPMSRRDDGQQAEYVQIELDTYLDRRTAYMFGVTASGVRLDHFHPTDNEDDTDSQFEPVWRARTSIDARGWTAELWVPFSQLRFNDTPERIWGLNVKRWRPSLNEEDYWVVIGRTARGWSSRFGDLRGIEGVAPKARLELLPYVAASSRVNSNRNPDNPFDDGLNLNGRVGADIKTGIGSNLTLEATFNPDFGQIEADPAEVNLTVFETIFSERRPFFTEGSSILAAGTSNYYYSRRIGARPTGPPTTEAAAGGFLDYPDVSTILGAAKLSGRLRSGTSVAFLAAVTDEESASTSVGGVESEIEVAPRTFWGVARAYQEFGNEGSTVGGHLTVVHRDLDPTDALASIQARNAITTGADTRIRFGNRTWEAAGNVGLTFLDGEPAAIARTQRASGHYFQRLDQPDIRFDGTRTNLNGLQIQGSLNKIGGRHWLGGYQIMIESPGFDPLDFGRLNYAGDFAGGPRLQYRETRPGRFFRAYSFQVNWMHYWFYDTNLGLRGNVSSNNSFTWKNFWVSTFNATQYIRGQDVQATRGGPSAATPQGWTVSSSLRNSTGARTRWTTNWNLKGNEFGEKAWEVTGSLSARPIPAIQLSVEPDYLNEKGGNQIFSGPIGRQFLTTLPGGPSATYGNRYVFGLVDRTTWSMQFRFNYTFKPDVTLDVYMEPFAASVAYRGFGELTDPRSINLRLYGTEGTSITRLPDSSYTVTDGASSFALTNRDQNVRSFRSNVVLKWEWRPGSTFYAVWQQNRASDQPNGEHVGLNDLFGSLSAPGDNIFAIKSTFWISR